MKYIKLLEELPELWDPTYSNSIFKIRFRQNNDLSNKKAPDTIDKPITDVLDGIERGDYVIGTSPSDEKEHNGIVTRIKKDEKGGNIMIEIEEDGKVIKLAPSTVKFAEGGDKGNVTGVKADPADTGNVDFAFGGYDNFNNMLPIASENLQEMKYLRKLENFNVVNENTSEFNSWKRKNVSLRGVKVRGQENGVYGSFGKGLYTVPLGNRAMAKQYGDVLFVVNAIPKNAKIVNTLNDAEMLRYKLNNGEENKNKNIMEQEMIKLGYDGLIIKGREYVNYKPVNILYFKTSIQLELFYNNSCKK